MMLQFVSNVFNVYFQSIVAIHESEQSPKTNINHAETPNSAKTRSRKVCNNIYYDIFPLQIHSFIYFIFQTATKKRISVAKYLSSTQLQNLKGINDSPSADSKFVSYLLCALFTESVLKESSYCGRSSNFNQKRHMALDSTRLELMKSK